MFNMFNKGDRIVPKKENYSSRGNHYTAVCAPFDFDGSMYVVAKHSNVTTLFVVKCDAYLVAPLEWEVGKKYKLTHPRSNGTIYHCIYVEGPRAIFKAYNHLGKVYSGWSGNREEYTEVKDES